MELKNWVTTALRKFSEVFRRQPNLAPEPPKYSTFTRFIFDKHFTKQPLMAKPGAFLPGSGLKTSALGKDKLSERSIWEIGIAIGKARQRLPKARADFSDNAVKEAKLTVEHDPQTEIPDHVNLCGWPIEKDEQKSIALLLCQRSKLILSGG